jgi:osmoprotectant transport system substrate-binding protein
VAASRRAALAALAACALALGLGACGDEDPPPDVVPGAGGGGAIARDAANARVTITVGAKGFTEQQVLGEIYAQGLEAAGFRTRRRLSLGDEQAAQEALRAREIDGYPEYTGTALLSLCDVANDDVPKDPNAAFDATRECFAEDGLVAFPPTPFTNSNEVGVRARVAERLDLQRISDLRRVDQDMTLYGTPECRRRADCLAGLQEVYGLRFARFVPVNSARRHDVLRNDRPVASIVFTTDPQNRREDIVLLEDDRGMFPPYNSTFVVRRDVAEAAGEALPRTVAQLQNGLTDEVMQELNARVDLDGETPRAVAQDYLRAAGLTG